MSQIHLSPELSARLGLSPAQISMFCQRWQIRELWLFGSALRQDFRADSDIDLLVSYQADAHHGLLARARMSNELEILCGRAVDLMTKQSIEQSQNELRRQDILASAQAIYVA